MSEDDFILYYEYSSEFLPTFLHTALHINCRGLIPEREQRPGDVNEDWSPPACKDVTKLQSFCEREIISILYKNSSKCEVCYVDKISTLPLPLRLLSVLRQNELMKTFFTVLEHRKSCPYCKFSFILNDPSPLSHTLSFTYTLMRYIQQIF